MKGWEEDPPEPNVVLLAFTLIFLAFAIAATWNVEAGMVAVAPFGATLRREVVGVPSVLPGSVSERLPARETDC